MVLDFREVDWSGFDRDALGQAEGVSDIRFGQFRPGWSRMVFDLEVPLVVETAGTRRILLDYPGQSIWNPRYDGQGHIL